MAITPDDELTRAAVSTVALTGDVSSITAGPPSTPHPHRFAPGAVIAGRYRVVALLGRGGMGEVYRAEDLALDQPVALKFLPGGVESGDARLAQFHNELRTARQVSHKNVCRLYDLGEAGDRRFLTMEYVDGEDLSSLLRRIGRIPHDKAVDIARQLCAGVAAAHDRGVVHRDLKPANIMIDADGDVRITDFGIATAESATAEFAGTLQYMAPEQFIGQSASTRSDIYALGLILFEVFTGRRAVDSKTLAELQDFHQRGAVTAPSSIVRDVDPAVERIILRCLERDPERRPVSALVVAAALPGTDPLAAALAAGETPSPTLLEAAGESDAVPARVAAMLAMSALAGILAFAMLSARSSIPGRVSLDLTPDVLTDRAQQVIEAFGYPPVAGDSAFGFSRVADYTRWLGATRETPERYAPVSRERPSAVHFWYRSSPRPLVARNTPVVSPLDPPTIESGMRTVVLDPRGRLQEFRSVPPQIGRDREDSQAVDWRKIFTAAGLDITAFTSVAPTWVPRDYADERAAWEGPLPDTVFNVRVEASAFRGRPTYFQVIGPWTVPSADTPRGRGRGDRVFVTIVAGVALGILGVAVLLARRNVHRGRADLRGAIRLVAFVAITGLLAWMLQADHTLSVSDELGVLGRAAQDLALTAAALWINYLALEPYVRRLWPDTLIGWSRLLGGHVRDSRVGRDLLIGIASGVAVALLQAGRTMLLPLLGYVEPSAPYGNELEMLAGAGATIGAWAQDAVLAVSPAALLTFIAVLIKLLIRRTWLARPLMALVFAVLFANELGTTNTAWIMLFPLAGGAVLAWVLTRYGLLSLVAGIFVFRVLTSVPFVPDPSHWSATAGNWTALALTSLTAFAFYAARAGQPLFGRVIHE